MTQHLDGEILVYCRGTKAGIIKAGDGRQYYFSTVEWFSPTIEPKADMAVAFVPSGGQACKVNSLGH